MSTDSCCNERRVILLLDLDCFYAQCEIVRLGLEKALPLALLQWDSALAVNYPARDLGIKRGDSFSAVMQKGAGKCVALHLPVIPLSAVTDSPSGKLIQGEESLDFLDDESIESAYNALYCLPRDRRDEEFRQEKNRMRRPNEGKASLERYRLASAMIFSVVTKSLSTSLGKGNFILERASIDELYVDVSDHCYNFSAPAWKVPGRGEESLDEDFARIDPNIETVVCGSAQAASALKEDDEVRALWRGCAVAIAVRTAVFRKLGFTLSAGISTNKLVSKLGAGYGKPNGQAVIFPIAIEENILIGHR